jgi:hypothetical protein
VFLKKKEKEKQRPNSIWKEKVETTSIKTTKSGLMHSALADREK